MPTSMESYGEANPLGICLCSSSAYILSSPESLLTLSWMRLDPGPCELQLGSSSTLLRLQGSGTISGPFQQSPEKMVGEEQGRSCDPGVSQASSVLSVTVSAFFFFFFQVQKSPSNLLSGSIFTWETPQSLSHSNRETRGTQSQKEQEMPGVHVFLS